MRMQVQVRASVATLALVAAACAGRDPAAHAPSAVDAPIVADAPSAGEGDLSEVLIVGGWSPYEVFAGGFNPWLEGAAIEVTAWLDQLLPARPAPAGAVRIDVIVPWEVMETVRAE